MITKHDSSQAITEEEAELYDRQIRLWGIDSQKRLRQARILLVGLSGIGVEVAKNVILAGVKSLTLMDDVVVTNEDVSTNFTLTRSDVGKNRAVSALPNIQKLNPMVQVSSLTSSLADKETDFFSDFDVVCCIGCSQDLMMKVNKICIDKNIQFIGGDSFGFYGFAFFDLGVHDYVEEIEKKVTKKSENGNAPLEPPSKKRKTETDTDDSTISVKKTMTFDRLENVLKGKDDMRRSPGLYDLMKVLWKFKDEYGLLPHVNMSDDKLNYLKELIQEYADEKHRGKPLFNIDNVLQFSSGEFSPSCAIIGGVIGQEVIKAISQKDPPLNNFFLFNGTEGSGYVVKIENKQ